MNVAVISVTTTRSSCVEQLTFVKKVYSALLVAVKKERPTQKFSSFNTEQHMYNSDVLAIISSSKSIDFNPSESLQIYSFFR